MKPFQCSATLRVEKLTTRRVVLLFIALLYVSAAAAQEPFAFRDVGDDAGLFPHVGGIAGHAAAWGDADGDGWIDLYVGTFHENDSKPNMFFFNREGKFELADQPELNISGRASGSVFADLDNDGDLDLYLSNLSGGKEGHTAADSRLFRNDGKGRFTVIPQDSGATPTGFRGRSAAVLDFDGDGLLDLLMGEGVYYGSPRRSRLIRNLGDMRFKDVSDEVGLPPGIPALGVAAGDVNNDGWPDIFLAASFGGNRLFLNDGRGKFREAACSPDAFAWEYTSPDDAAAGVAFGDVNGDGMLDIVVGQHFKRPWLKKVPVRLYLNCGIEDGEPRYEDATDSAGLIPLPLKAPHVEIRDFDNDGRPDIYTSLVKFAGGKAHPVIFRNVTVRGGPPKFEPTGLDVNDFPTDEDRNTGRTNLFFDKMLADGKVIYMAPGPSGDFDNDGRLDLFLCNWWTESRSLLLKNETDAGNWLQVRIAGKDGVNTMGIGARIKVYEPGKLGDARHLLSMQEIAVGYGYASGQPAIAHIGLGEYDQCDIEVVLPHAKGRLERRDIAANQRITIPHFGK